MPGPSVSVAAPSQGELGAELMRLPWAFAGSAAPSAWRGSASAWHSLTLLLPLRVSLASRELLGHLETEDPLAPWVLLASLVLLVSLDER